MNTPERAQRSDAAPHHGKRIGQLDTLRGLAVLGIFAMNSVSLGLGTAAYFNISLPVDSSALDRALAIAVEIVVDQKFMALFSILFGAGITLLHERLVKAYGPRKALHISLWRYFLLLLIGTVHTLLWLGDVLVIYALAAPLLLAVRHWRTGHLLVIGILVLSISPLATLLVHAVFDPNAVDLGEFWGASDAPVSDSVDLWLLTDFASHALGMMLIGMALLRLGFLNGSTSRRWLWLIAVMGIVPGLGLSVIGMLWLHSHDFAPAVALVGSIPNTLGTLPAVLGYIALFTLWANVVRPGTVWRFQAVGRMALSNYLAQTCIGLLLLLVVLDPDALSRRNTAAVVLLVWILQLWWSPRWLARYRQGPVEWLWRSASERRWLLLRCATPQDDTTPAKSSSS